MQGKRTSIVVLAGIAASAVTAAIARAQHSDFVVARDAFNKLAVESPDSSLLNGQRAIIVELVDAGPLAGYYASNQPGWESIEADEPDEGLFMLAAGHRIALRRVSWDAGFEMFETSFSPILSADGSNYEFPHVTPGEFHEDLFFAMSDATFIAGDEVTGQFRLVDLSGTYSDSDPFTLRLRALVSVPAMSGWAVAALASLTIAAGASVLRRVMPAVV